MNTFPSRTDPYIDMALPPVGPTPPSWMVAARRQGFTMNTTRKDLRMIRTPTIAPTALALLFAILAAPPAAAQADEPASVEQAPVEPTEIDGAPRRVSAILIDFTVEGRGLPEPEAVLEAEVELTPTPEGYLAPRPGWPRETLRLADIPDLDDPRFYDSAIALLSPAVVRRMQEFGFIGIYVEPDPNELTVVDGQVVDLRPEGVTTLTLNVTVGVVTELRTIGSADYLPEDQRINNPAHRRLRARSPVQPAGAEDETDTNLLRRDLIDDYVYFLNRHPGRRVDVALSASGAEAGAVDLDYMISENRPWFLYTQVANNGTESTGDWRQRFGFVHNQLTRRDDIFSIDYLTANFDDLNALTASYERPFFDQDRLRWRVFGSYYEYTASDVGQGFLDFDGEGFSFGGEMAWNFLQQRDAFLDLVAGARYENVEVDNEFAQTEGDEDFFLPYIGLRFERQREAEQITAGVFLEGNLSGLAGTSDSGVDELGRTDADDSFALIRFDGRYAFYLDPLLHGDDPPEDATLAHEFVLSARGQAALGDARLAPNFQDIAGGLYSVRGYPEAVAAGDSVIIASAEYRFHLPRALPQSPQPARFLGRPFRFSPQYVYGPTDWDLILKAFVDFGRTIQNDRLSFESNETLVGAGIGIELSISRNLTARLDWGFALNDLDDPSGDQSVDVGDSELHFVLTLVY